MPTRRQSIVLGAASVFAPNLVRAASINAWPDRTVHMVVPNAAGGPTDVNARIVAEQLSKIWGQQVVIDNKAGAGTNIGNAFVAHSNPDGYTLLFGTSSLASNGALYRSLDYSPITDLRPISLVARFPFFMFVPNSSPAKTVQEFVELRETAARKAHYSFSRHRERPTPCGVIVSANDRYPNDARAVSRRSAGIHGPDPGSCSLLFRQRRIAHLFAVRPGPRACLDGRQAITSSAGGANYRRSGRSRLCG